MWAVTSAAAASSPEPEIPPTSFDEVSRRVERLLNRVGVGGRPTSAEVDPVLRDAAKVPREDQLARRLREFDQDVRDLAIYGTQPPESTLPRGSEVPEQQRGAAQRETSAGRRPAPEPMAPKGLVARCAALVDAVKAGVVVTLKDVRDAQNEVRAAMDETSSLPGEIASTLTTILDRLAEAELLVKAGSHRGVGEADASRAAISPARQPAHSNPVAFIGSRIRGLGPAARESEKRTTAQEAQASRNEADRLTRALELGEHVPQQQTCDVLYRFATMRTEPLLKADREINRKTVQRLKAADLKARRDQPEDR